MQTTTITRGGHCGSMKRCREHEISTFYKTCSISTSLTDFEVLSSQCVSFANILLRSCSAIVL